ncbi:MAG: DNA alkylation repair protein [Bacteroidota bacterium]
MLSNRIMRSIRADLRASVDLKAKESFQKFFKEKIRFYGVRTAAVRRLAKKYWKELSRLDKKTIFTLCEELLASDYTEEAFIVSFWLPMYVKSFENSDLEIFERWIYTYINNWAKCDGFCNHTVGDFIEKFPESIARMLVWAESKNRWLRRASAVSLIVPAKKGKHLETVLAIADLLIRDNDDIVQKGYGWLLKEASRKHLQEVFQYVMKHKAVMPRTALRYAVELMPHSMRMRAMKTEKTVETQSTDRKDFS